MCGFTRTEYQLLQTVLDHVIVIFIVVLQLYLTDDEAPKECSYPPCGDGDGDGDEVEYGTTAFQVLNYMGVAIAFVLLVEDVAKHYDQHKSIKAEP